MTKEETEKLVMDSVKKRPVKFADEPPEDSSNEKNQTVDE